MAPATQLTAAMRLSKLRAMSRAEVFHRLRYKIDLAVERRQHRAGRLAPPDRLQQALRPELRGGEWQARLLATRAATTARFFDSLGDGQRCRTVFVEEYAPERADALHHADRARARRFEFFGHDFHLPGEIPWHADPVSGVEWPRVFHADVPVHKGDVGFGDVKHVWELSRQQYLIDLGKAYYVERRQEDLDALRHLVTSWIDANPYGIGVNWACALEPAFRAWSWLWAYHFTQTSLDDEFHLRWLAGFYDHGRFLAKHLEHYSSPYNHLIGEASALYALGTLFPEFDAAESWRAAGRAILERRLREQFYADGGSVEQSTFYHHATLGFYLLSGILGRANGDEFSPDVWQAISRGLEFSLALMQPDGRTPEIGGADDGKPIRLQHLPFWDFRPYLAIGAVLLERGDFKWAATRFWEDALWLLGAGGLESFSALAATAPAQTAIVLRSSGYVVSRSDWSATADYVCFDVGEQAAGMRSDAIPNSMHGHADCLSIILWLEGRRVLVDSGLYAYNCGGVWEAHFRETAAHNTVKIDGRDQARHLGKMAWSHSYRASIDGSLTSPAEAWAIGSHDGYARGPQGVTHRRTVWRRPAGYLVVHDQFEGQGTHEFEVNYQFAPGTLELGCPGALFGDAVDVVWTSPLSWSAEVRHGGANPEDGWICPSLGVRAAAPRLTLRTAASTFPMSLLTIFATRPGRRSRVLVPPAAEAAAIGVETGGTVEWIHGAHITRGPIRTDGVVAICSATESRVLERSQAGGSFVDVDEAAILRLHVTRSKA